MSNSVGIAFFLHINKNAGNTMRYIMHKNYSPQRFFEMMLQRRSDKNGLAKTVDSIDQDMQLVIANIQARQSNLDCISANLPFGIHRFLYRPVKYFALLREPISRCISYWYFAYQTRFSTKLWSYLERYNFDLDNILQYSPLIQFKNDQVRMISGCSAIEVGEKEFDVARRTIENDFLFVGSVDQFDLCLSKIADFLGWKNKSYVKQNIGDKNDRSILPERAEEYFRDSNKWDTRLYNWLMEEYLPKHL